MPDIEELKKLFSMRLQRVMEERDINQAELSKILNVSESTVGKWLLQISLPRMGVIQKIADHFNLGKSYFLEEDFPTSYYDDPDVAAIANEMKENPDIKVLFDASRGLSKESIEEVRRFVEYQKAKERGDYDA
ncbi:helix-turn-helix transcriptional regulator [Selenomonas noxia]|uniref:helix-turn-helix domain-containing protein n=1 Tax=Selenomonas noxia TaxID=135083 RepID=UPI0028E3E13B|nr:helix-turn-helix transcriptional regulator [Selenomonas noxia]